MPVRGQKPKRSYNSDAYRYGFNGMEADNELKGEGNSYTTLYRQYDPRISRWLSVDPVFKKYPSYSPYTAFNNNPNYFQDPDGDDPITAIVEGATAFGLEAGLDFMTNMLLKDQDAGQAFDNINWKAAAFEGAKATAISFIAPTGSQTAVRLAKLGKSKIGKLTTSFVSNLTSDVLKNIYAGKYNDVNGDFDYDLLESDFEELVYSAGITTLIEAGLGSKAQDLVDKLAKTNKTYASKFQKLINKMDNGESTKRLNNYEKKVNQAEKEVLNTTKKVVVAKTEDAVAKKTGDEAQKKVRGKK